MKQTVTTIALGFALLGLSACTTQPEMLNDTSKVPVIMHGKADVNIAKNSKIIILMPAGTTIPFNLKIGGDVFKKNVHKTFPLKLRRDTYMYVANMDNNQADASSIWISYDKKEWRTMQDTYGGTLLLDVDVSAKDASIDLDFEANNKK